MKTLNLSSPSDSPEDICSLFPETIQQPKYAPLRQILSTLSQQQKDALLGEVENSSSQEIERKFCLPDLPHFLEGMEGKHIAQYYLFVGNTEMRMRDEAGNCTLTLKKGKGLKRTEVEIPMSKDEFEQLLPLALKSLEKTRYKVPLSEHHIADVDTYPDGLLTVEVEFSHEEDAQNFDLPDWFGEEITGNSAFSNSNLAHNIPQISSKFQRSASAKQELSKNLCMPTLNLEDGYSEIIERIDSLWDEKEHILVNVAGGSASGKTSQVAKKVYEHYGEDALLISMDNYYKGNSYMEEFKKQNNIELNYDQPEVIDIPLLQQHLQDLKQGKPIQQPLYDFSSGERNGEIELLPKKIIIVEGLFPLDERLAKEADVKTFVDVSFHGALLRRLMRDIKRGSWTIAQNMEYIFNTAEPMKKKYIDPTIKNADFIISNEYDPFLESRNAPAHEQQIKFEQEINRDMLSKLGAERLGSSRQTDYYFSTRNPEEQVRIRDEDDTFIFSYKGPKASSGEKYKLEFEISNEIKDLLSQYYGANVKVIKKERKLFALDGILFSLDSIFVEDGQKRDFIEIRLPYGENEKAHQLFDKLGLKDEDKKQTSYFQLIG